MLAEKILVVDDDETFQKVTKSFLVEEGFLVDVVESVEVAQEQMREKVYDLVLTDLVMTGRTGLELLDFVKAWAPDTAVVMITGFASVDSAVQAIKAGAQDYLTKPCSSDELLLKIKRVFEARRNRLELSQLRQEVSEKYTFANMIGKSPEIRSVFRMIAQVTETDAAVLIQGETGTGKELVAKAIHYNSLRKEKPFVAVNCAALSETLLESELFGHERGAFTGAIKQKLGRFELAHEGTLFLDEVGDIPLSTQAKLLRVLQEKEFERVGGTETVKTNIRILSATNKDLKEAIAEKIFREDLYYRISVLPIDLPPLRTRREDITLLCHSFVEKYSTRISKKINGIAASALDMLLMYPWPGNVRELENVIERAVIMCNGEQIEAQHLLYLNHQRETRLLTQALQKQLTEAQLVKLYAGMVLREKHGHKKLACETLDINFRTLQKRLEP